MIDAIDGTARLDRNLSRSRASVSYNILRQRTDAFQLVAGQNPDSEIHAHRCNSHYGDTVITRN